MTKADLKQKWSQYCDTDKLVADTIALLKKYKHRNTEHGVCTMLDTYFTNKEPLIRLFMTSKNYIGDMRISIVKEFERKIDCYSVSACIDKMCDALNCEQIRKQTDSQGKRLIDYLVVGKNCVPISELVNTKQSKERLANLSMFDYYNGCTHESNQKYNEFANYIRYFRSCYSRTVSSREKLPLLINGTKTTRALNKVCVHYGVDKFNPRTVVDIAEDGTQTERTIYPYNQVFAEYSDLMSEANRKLNFVISLNPLDYLTMSFGVNWKSCHNIRDGCYMGGCLSYMLDGTSMITFVVDNLDGNIHEIPKIYRQMYHLKGCLFLQNRLYPQGNDGATNLYDKFREFVIEEFSVLLNHNGEWSDTPYYNCNVSSIGAHYKDYVGNRSCRMFFPEEMRNDASNTIIHIGHAGICVDCGGECTASNRLNHNARYDCQEVR